eukprot:jgi/Chrzof1/5678/Cz16g11120.t1
MFQVDACQLPANWTSVASQLPALGASPDGVILHKVFVSHDDLAAAAAATTAAGKLQQDECLVDSTASLSLGQCCDASRNTEKLDCSSDDSQQQASGEARQLQSSYAAGAGQLPSGCEAEAAMQLLMNLLKTVPVAGQDNQQASQHADAVDMCTQDRHAVCGGNGDEHGDTLVGCNGKDHVDTNLSLSCLSVQQMLTQLIAQAAADGSSNSNDECLLSSGSSNLTGSSTSTPTTSSSSSDSSSSTAGQGPPARPGRYVQIPEVVEVKNHCPFVFRHKRRGVKGTTRVCYSLKDTGPRDRLLPQWVPQLQLHMLATGCMSALLVSRSASQGIRVFRVFRSEFFINSMLRILVRLQQEHVQTGVMPKSCSFLGDSGHSELVRETVRIAQQAQLVLDCTDVAVPTSATSNAAFW